MKKHSYSRLASRMACVVLAVLTLGAAHAATFLWNGGGADANWSTGANWNGGVAPTNNGTAVIVLAGTNLLTPNVNAAWSINSLTYSNGAGAFVLGGSTLTIGSGGITNNSTNGQSINNAIILGAGQTWIAASNNLAFSGNINNVSNLLTISGGFNAIISGNISGTGGLTKSGTGTNFLSGSNSFSGLTTVSAGALNVQNGAAVGSTGGAVTVSSGAALQLQGGITVTAGTLSLNGSGLASSGALRNLSGDNTWSSAITLAGTTTIADDAGTLTLGGNITNISSTTTFTNSGTILLNGSMGSSTGPFVKSGVGTLILGATNNYTGSTTLNGGTVQFGAGGSLSALSAITVNTGATLDLNGRNETIGTLAGAGNVTLGGGTLTAGGTSSTTFSGVMSGTGGFIKTGTGTLTFSGVNTYSGGTTINAGAISIKADNNLGNTVGGITINGGTLTTSATLTSARIITLGASGGIINAGGTTLTLSGVISGPGLLTKIGTKTLSLTGTNTYQGNTIVSAGTLTVNSDAALGNATNSITLSNATLSLNASFATPRACVLLAGTNFLLVNTGFTNTFSGVISGSAAVTKSGSGVLVLTGANTFTNFANVSAGTLRLGTNNPVVTNNLINISSSSATFDLNGFSQTLGGLIGSGKVTLGSGTLTAGGNNTTTNYTGVMSGTGNFIKAGTGTLTFSGANTYTGVTTVSAGTLQASANGRFAATSQLVVNSGAVFNLAGFTQTFAMLTGAGSVTLGSGTLTAGNTTNATFSGSLSGTGGFIKAGAGTQIFSGTNLHSGATALNAGNLQVTGSVSNSALTIASGATLSGNGSVGSVIVNSGGTNAPGAGAPGTLVSAAQTWLGGGSYLWQINNPTGVKGGNSGWCWQNINGTLAIAANTGSKFTIRVVSLTPANAGGLLTNFNNTTAYVWTIASASGGISGFNAANFTIDTSAFQNSLGAGSFSLSQSGNDLNLIFTTAALATISGVQSGVLTNSAGGTNSVAISAVNPASSFLIFNSRHNGTAPANAMVRGRIASSNTVEFARATGGAGAVNIQWYVISYTNGVKVQRGEINQTNTVIDIPIAAVAATNQAFVTWSKTPDPAATLIGNDDPLVGDLTSVSNLEFRAGSASSSVPVISWQVVEYTHPASVYVQRGSVTNLTGTNLSASAALSAPLNTGSTFLLTGYRTAGSGTNVGARLLRAQIAGPLSLTFDRSISGAPDDVTEIGWQAVQLNDGSLVQQGSVNFASGVAQTNVAITSLNTNRVAALSSTQPAGGQNTGRSPGTGTDPLGVGSATLALTTSSQITLDRNSTTQSADIPWQVVGFGPGTLFSPATGGYTISADTKGVTYTSLTGPIYTEILNGNVGAGTVIFNAPAGFIFDTGGVAPTVLITRVGGAGANLLNIDGVASGTAVPMTSVTTTNMTLTITNASSGGVTCSLTWQNLRVRPSAGTPLASGNITPAGTSVIQGVTNTTSCGFLGEVVGAATKLALQTAPSSSATAGVEFAQQPVIQIQDQFGNPRSADNSTVITAGVNTGTGILQGTLTATALNGSAAFSSLSYQVAETMTIAFSSPGLTSKNSGNIVVSAAPASQVVILTQPSINAVAGVNFPQQPVVQIKDSFGNLRNSDNSSVVVATLDQGTDVLFGTQTNTAVNGVVTFTNLSYQTAETITLDFISGTLDFPISAGTVVGPAAASQMEILTQPSPLATAGTAFAQQPVIAIEDQFGNLRSADNSSVVTASRDAGSGAGALHGTVNATANGGLATFTSLAHNVAGLISLDFASGSLTGTNSGSIQVNPAGIAQLAFSTQPGSAVVGSSFGVQPTVVIQDAFGNSSTASLGTNLTVNVALTSGTGTLQGTTGINAGTSAGNGTAAFGNLRLDSAGVKQLTASASGLSNAVSTNFTVAQGSQTITFGSLAGQTYGNSPFALSASASSGLPVNFNIVSGPATIAGATLTITGNGTVTVQASQAGNTDYLAATPVSQSFVVAKAALTITADNQTRVYGATNPPLIASYSGFVNEENTNVLAGAPAISTTATTNSTVTGSPYTITISLGSLSAANYTFTFVNGSLTITPASSSLTLSSSANPSPASNAVTFTATVSAIAPGGGTPTGTVQFLTNGVTVGAAISLTNGVTTFGISTLPHATNHLTAQYTGDANFTGSTNILDEIINSAPAVGTASYARPQNTTFKIKVANLLTNASDADGDALTLTAVAAHSTNNAAVSINGNFVIYQPPATNANVTDSFSYTVSDSFAATNSGIVFITILSTNTDQSVNITGFKMIGGNASVGFAAIPGRTYYVQASTNPPVAPWITIGTNVTPTNGQFQFLDTQASNFPTRFYRTAAP